MNKIIELQNSKKIKKFKINTKESMDPKNRKQKLYKIRGKKIMCVKFGNKISTAVQYCMNMASLCKMAENFISPWRVYLMAIS